MMAERVYLILRLDAPMQAWGGVAMDPLRPTRAFPTRSALAGLLASALGWTYREGQCTTDLQDALHFGVREDRQGQVIQDYQTADLGRIGREGWTRWGLERRGGGTAATGTQILEKAYLADTTFTVALTLGVGAPVSLDALEEALLRPARPLFLGRKGCPPASRIFVGRVRATTAFAALGMWPLAVEGGAGNSNPLGLRCWYMEGEGPVAGEPQEVWDRRDFVTDRFGGARVMRAYRVPLPEGGEGAAGGA